MSLAEKIAEILEKELSPQHCEVINDSALHAGHGGDDGSGESHFRLVVVSDRFERLSRVERHRLVYGLLKAKLGALPHALAIMALAPGEK